MNTAIPLVSDHQFAHGFDVLPDVPDPDIQTDASWRAVARHLVENGMGACARLTPKPGITLVDALRLVGALLATAGAASQIEKIAAWLATLFVFIQPEDGPKARAWEEGDVFQGT